MTMTEQRLTSGAHITLSGVHLNGREFEEFDVLEVAAIVGRFMFERAEPIPGQPGRACRWALPTILGALWPGIEATRQTRERIGRVLRMNGFRAMGGGTTPFLGYLVPDVLPTTWQGGDPDAGRPVRIREVEPEPVKTRWACAHPGCKENAFESKADRDAHYALHRRATTTKEATMATTTKESAVSDAPKKKHVYGPKVKCPECGVRVSKSLLEAHRKHIHQPTPKQLRLLAAIQEFPGKHPREYVDLLTADGVTKSSLQYDARALTRLGYIRSEGKTMGVRYFPVDASDRRTEAAPVATPVAVYRCSVCGGTWEDLASLRRHVDESHTPHAVPADGSPEGFGTATAAAAIAGPGTLEAAPGVRVRQAVLVGDEVLVVDGVVFAVTMRRVS